MTCFFWRTVKAVHHGGDILKFSLKIVESPDSTLPICECDNETSTRLTISLGLQLGTSLGKENLRHGEGKEVKSHH